MSNPISLHPTKRGSIKIGDKCDITDPCYNRAIWCRLNDVAMEPGEYHVVTYSGTEKYQVAGKPVSDTRIWILSVAKEEGYDADQMEEIGKIGVDSGLAGIFPAPYDALNDEDWNQFTCDISGKDSLALKGGFCCNSGYGDGSYPVFALKNDKGQCVAIEIRF